MLTKYQAGLTLAELLIVVALLAILAQLGVPAWQEFIAKTRSQTLKHSLERSIHQARATAVTRRIRTQLCGRSAANECHADWSSGWLILEVSPDALPVQVTELAGAGPKLQWAGFQKSIVFHPTGLSSTGNGRFFVCRKQKIDWQLVLNRQGRLRRASEQENRQEDHRCG